MVQPKKNYKEIYQEIDPILKKDKEITWTVFQEKYPEIAKKITLYVFYNRKRISQGKPGYGCKKKTKLTKRKEVPIDVELVGSTGSKKVDEVDILNFVNKLHPNSKCKKEYVRIGKALLKTPSISYPDLKKKKVVKMTNPCYYAFKTEFNSWVNGKATMTEKAVGKNGKKNRKYNKSVIYRTLYENHEKLSDQTIRVAKEIIGSLSEDKRMNVQLQELKEGIEIRTFTK